MEEKKKCPFCQSEINSKASVCPNCGKGITLIDSFWRLFGNLIIIGIGLYLMHIGGVF